MQTKRHLVVVAGIMTTFLASLDATVVGTAMPTITAVLGGLSIYPWVFSAFLLASTVTVPLYGKAADLFGRKPAFFVGVGLFMLGSLLCATASTMTELILWRALQGVGAGGVLPVTMTIIGDLYAAQERARIQGFFSAVWAVSSIVGPLAGALFVEVLSWHWIFLINLPFGFLALGIMATALEENVAAKAHRLDLLGALLLTAAATSLMWAMLTGGRTGVMSVAVRVAFVASAVLALLFVLQERRHPEPMLPPALLRIRPVAVAAAAGVCAGVILFGCNSYLPAFVQGALGLTPKDAGLALLPMGIGWPLAANLSGSALKRLGYRRSALLGGAFLVLGTSFFLRFDAHTSQALIMVAVGITGLGMGFSTTVLLIAAQEAVPWAQRGAATAMVQFARTIGGAVGVAVMGAALSASLRQQLGATPELLTLANEVMDPHRRGGVATATVAVVQGALATGLGEVFLGLTLAGLMAVVVTFAFPRGFAPAARATPSATSSPSR
ncbi:MAG: MFS transporter [Deltaproteobacteria bacterium]|nr:MFS transporter [Deltaproteobacteria bacterium]